jgi:hypothetical protein
MGKPAAGRENGEETRDVHRNEGTGLVGKIEEDGGIEEGRVLGRVDSARVAGTGADLPGDSERETLISDCNFGRLGYPPFYLSIPVGMGRPPRERAAESRDRGIL